MKKTKKTKKTNKEMPSRLVKPRSYEKLLALSGNHRNRGNYVADWIAIKNNNVNLDLLMPALVYHLQRQSDRLLKKGIKANKKGKIRNDDCHKLYCLNGLMKYLFHFDCYEDWLRKNTDYAHICGLISIRLEKLTWSKWSLAPMNMDQLYCKFCSHVLNFGAIAGWIFHRKALSEIYTKVA